MIINNSKIYFKTTIRKDIREKKLKTSEIPFWKIYKNHKKLDKIMTYSEIIEYISKSKTSDLYELYPRLTNKKYNYPENTNDYIIKENNEEYYIMNLENEILSIYDKKTLKRIYIDNEYKSKSYYFMKKLKKHISLLKTNKEN